LPEDQSQGLTPETQDDLVSLPDLTQYTIDLTIDNDPVTFEGHARVDVTNSVGKTLDSLFFRLLPNAGQSYGNGWLKVLQTQVDGQLVETGLSVDDTALRVDLPQGLTPGERTQVEFDFQGRVPVDFGGGQTPDAYGIYNFSQGVLALSGWYPILAVYDENGWHLDPVSPLGDSVFSQTALYTVDITLPAEQILIATGVEVGRVQSGDQIKYRLVSGPTRDFFIAASHEFQKVSQTVDGTRINAYFLPGYATAGAAGLSTTASSLGDYNQRFGKYPFSELDVVQAPLRNALGVEYPGVVLIGAGLYDKPDDPSFTVTIAHEVAHQWWYNVVGNDVFAEPWLDEGLTTYSSGVYYQDEFGEGAYRGLVSFWQGRYDTLVQDGKDDVVTQALKHFESLSDPRVYGGVVYTKAALFFKALRQEIGDQAFFTALQAYYRLNQYQVATGDDLLADFEDAAGQQLDGLYDQWLYSKK
jgi:aminopeptidase N